MGDFYQSAPITTLHRLGKHDYVELEAKLERYSRFRSIALILPSLYSELSGEALKNIVNELKSAKYIRQVVVTLGKTGPREFKKAKDFFSILPQETKLIWNDGKNIQSIYKLLARNDLNVGEDGKGRSVWMAYGYVLASGLCDVIVLHDCDIISYSRELLARLCYPVTSPTMDYEFCKGYYSRVTDRMYGRATRLFLMPLIETMQKIFGHLPFLDYISSFRYALAGEFSMLADLARVNRIPGDWGLEVGVLAEIYRNCASKRICQVEICENYEHKHQPLSPDDPGSGLLKMSVDIARSLFTTLATEGVVLSEAFFRTLFTGYLRTAQDAIKKYNDDADMNGLIFDRHEEGIAVETFSKGIRIASEKFIQDPMGTPLIPNWNRVMAAVPDIFDMLRKAADEDNS